MKKYKLTRLWVLVVLDVLVFATILASFSYFHHIKRMWGVGNGGDGEETTTSPQIIFTKPPTVKPPIVTTAPKPPVFTGSWTGSGDPPVVTEPNTPPDPPVIVDEGDFGASFPGVFANEGEIIKTENSYVSHDISITYHRKVIDYASSTDIVYYYYDIYIRNIENLYTVSTKSGTRQYLDKLEEYALDLTDAEGNKMYSELPLLSMNGDLYKNNKWPLVVRNGALYKNDGYINSDVGILYYDGSFEVVAMKDYNWKRIAEKGPYQIWHFGPGLLDGKGNTRGTESKDYKDNYDGMDAWSNAIVGGGNPRTAIGYYEPGHYCFVVVDGRRYRNVSVPKLAEIMASLGCMQAYNLDGGNTSQVKFLGEYQRKSDEGSGQRKVDDIICIGELAKKD